MITVHQNLTSLELVKVLKKNAKICNFYVVGRNLLISTSQHKDFKILKTPPYSAYTDVFKKYFILTVHESIV